MTRVNGMHKCLYVRECRWFSLLTHNIFNVLSKTRIVSVLENIMLHRKDGQTRD